MDVSITRYQATGRFRKTTLKRMIASRGLVPAIVLGIVVVCACVHVWQRNYVLELEKKNVLLEEEKMRLNDLIKKTGREVTELSRLSRIEQVALERLGLQRTSAGNIFRITVEKPEVKREGLDNVFFAVQKLVNNLPVISETKADTLKEFRSDGQ